MRAPFDALLAASPATSSDRTDGRERVAVPLIGGLLAALGASALGILAAVVGMLALTVVGILVLGNVPSAEAGHPLFAATELIFYAAAGAFGWWRLRALRPDTFRWPNPRDLRVFALGIAALIGAKLLLMWQLALAHQSGHVQSGFEHFDVMAQSGSVTALGIGLTLAGLVVVGPLVEEIVFRGLLFGALASRLGVLGGAAISALLFGAVHGDPVLFPWLLAVGLVNALAYAATGNLAVPVALHALSNALSATILIESSLHAH
ncbi:MAG: type II CAAX endopeptidase family protein [Vulcanimicrobiaceae bacterium]|jgi:membrane protease YdiL (CAAX protease family)